MALKRITTRALATLTLWAGFGLTASAQLPAMTVEKALEIKPKQAGVNVSTPAPGEVGRCRVDPSPARWASRTWGTSSATRAAAPSASS